jgi:anti-sigma B factor antagonist
MASSDPFSVDRVDQPGGPVLLRLRGELDVLTAPVVRAQLLDLMARRPALVVDLQLLDFMDSSGLAVMLELRSRARSSGWSVSVRGARGRVRQLLERTGTLTLVEAEQDDLPTAPA